MSIMAMLEKIEITSFRGIKNLSINTLGNVNLIVGDNNSGKTSILEAIQLLRTPGLGNIYRIARQREILYGMNASSVYEEFISMFSGLNGKLCLGVSCEMGGDTLESTITGTIKRILLEQNITDRVIRRESRPSEKELETDEFEGVAEYRFGNSVRKENITVNRYSRLTGTTIPTNETIRIVYLSPFDHLKGNIIGMIVRNDGYKEICLKALQLFDPDIYDMLILPGDSGDGAIEYLKHRKLGIMPLSTFGDGIKKVLVLSNAIASACGRVLLIDEIDTALHKKYYDDIFRFIVKAAKAFKVQVFITTHNIEAIDGILATQDYDKQTTADDIMVITLKKESTHTCSRVMPGREVFKNREDFGFEVRL